MLWVILFAMTSPAIAQDNVKLNVDNFKRLIADFNSCEDISLVSTKKIGTLSEIVAAEKARADNLYLQSELCEENLMIVETQADEWEVEYTQCIEDSIDCGELPWYKVDWKSFGIGVGLVLLLL